MTDATERAVAAITRTIGQGGDPTWTAHAILTALRGLGWRPTNAQAPLDWRTTVHAVPPSAPTPEWYAARQATTKPEDT